MDSALWQLMFLDFFLVTNPFQTSTHEMISNEISSISYRWTTEVMYTSLEVDKLHTHIEVAPPPHDPWQCHVSLSCCMPQVQSCFPLDPWLWHVTAFHSCQDPGWWRRRCACRICWWFAASRWFARSKHSNCGWAGSFSVSVAATLLHVMQVSSVNCYSYNPCF